MKDKFYDFFPTNLFSRCFMKIKYFFQNILFSKCVSEKTKRANYIRTELAFEHATEAYEIIWQNFYIRSAKNFYIYLPPLELLFYL